MAKVKLSKISINEFDLVYVEQLIRSFLDEPEVKESLEKSLRTLDKEIENEKLSVLLTKIITLEDTITEKDKRREEFSRCIQELEHYLSFAFKIPEMRGEDMRSVLNSQSWTFAKLYFSIGELELARRCISNYLIDIPDSVEAHKLLGDILRKFEQRDATLEKYHYKLDFDQTQSELILKVCELIAENDSVELSSVRYWCEQAQQLNLQNQTVLALKERLNLNESKNTEELWKVLSELELQPNTTGLRVHLLNHLLENNQINQAYKHIAEIEKENLSIFANNFVWYETLTKVLVRYKNENFHRNDLNWDFWILLISVLDKLITLGMDENSPSTKSLTECTNNVFNLDQTLLTACEKISENCTEKQYSQEFFIHYKAQLCFHMAMLVFKQAKQYQITFKEATNFLLPLLLISYHSQPMDLKSVWLEHANGSVKKQVQQWHREASFRCSQAGHILQVFAKGRRSNFSERIIQLCFGSWREKIFNNIFITRDQQMKIISSYFVNSTQLEDIIVKLPDTSDLIKYDETAQLLYPDSLHNLIWIGLNNQLPKFHLILFEGIQYSVSNLDNCAAETLNILDIEAFIYCCILCAQSQIEDTKQFIYSNHENPNLLPSCITEPLGNTNQVKWFSSVYKMVHNENISDTNDLKETIKKGIQIIRCIGSHGLVVKLLVQLANIFTHKARHTEKQSEIEQLEIRAEMYWKAALTLLEKLRSNQTITYPVNRWFEYRGKDMTPTEINDHIEEGKLFLSLQLMKKKDYDKALQILKNLKSPYASYYQAQIHMILGEKQLGQDKENITSEMCSQNITLLSKAKDYLYLTLDRLPEVDQKHPLNTHIDTEIKKIETILSRADSDRIRNEKDYEYENVSSISNDVDHLPQSSVVNDNLTFLNDQLQRTIALEDATYSHISEQNKMMIDSYDNVMDELRSFKEVVTRLTSSMNELNGVKNSVDELKVAVDDLNNMKETVEEIKEIKKDIAELKQIHTTLRPINNKKPTILNQSYIYRIPNTKNDHLFNIPHSDQSSPDTLLMTPTTFSITESPTTGSTPTTSLLTFTDPLSSTSRIKSELTPTTTSTFEDFKTDQFGFKSIKPEQPTFEAIKTDQTIFGSIKIGQPMFANNKVGRPIVISAKTYKSTFGVNKTDQSTFENVKTDQPTSENIKTDQSIFGGIKMDKFTFGNVKTDQFTFGSVKTDQSTFGNVKTDQPIFGNIKADQPACGGIKTDQPTFGGIQMDQPSFGNDKTDQSTFGNIKTDQSPSGSLKTDQSFSGSLKTDQLTFGNVKVNQTAFGTIKTDQPAFGGIKTDQPTFGGIQMDQPSFGNDKTDQSTLGLLKTDQPTFGNVKVNQPAFGSIKTDQLFFGGLKMDQPSFGNDKTDQSTLGNIKTDQSTSGSVKTDQHVFGGIKMDQPTFGNDKTDQSTLGCLKTDQPTFGNVKTNQPAFGSIKTDQLFFGGLKIDQPNFGNDKTNQSTLGNIKTDQSTSGSIKTDQHAFGGIKIDQPTFGGIKIDQSSFGNLKTNQPTFENIKTDQPAFGDVKTVQSTFGCLKTDQPIFGSAKTEQSIFGSIKSDKPSFSSVQTVQQSFGSTIFGGSNFVEKPQFGTIRSFVQPQQQSERKDAPVLDNDTGLNFAGLSLESSTFIKKDESKSFMFEGAGTPVFGSKQNKSTEKSTTTTASANANEMKEDEAETGAEAGDDNYDPHYEPIIPLPDQIVVKTGEEDEEVLFKERAKLYKFTEGQWKERGVGQIKILYHPVNRSYRFLLRREQVHKLVLNQLITSDLDAQPMQTSDRAWCWGGYNHSEDGAALEKLAVRFKNPELAQLFYNAVESVIEKIKSSPKKDVEEDHEDNDDENDDHNSDESNDDNIDESDNYNIDESDNYNIDESDNYNIDESDNYNIDESDETSIMFVKQCTLSMKEGNDWKTLGVGQINIYYDSYLCGGKIVMYDDNGKEISNTVIAINTVLKVEDTSCIWRAMEWALDPAVPRILRAIFSSHAAAEEMYYNYKECLQYAQQSEIVDKLPEENV